MSALARLTAGLGIFLLAVVFLRACLSPPMQTPGGTPGVNPPPAAPSDRYPPP